MNAIMVSFCLFCLFLIFLISWKHWICKFSIHFHISVCDLTHYGFKWQKPVCFAYMCLFQPPTHMMATPIPTSLPPPIRMRVRVQEDVFLIPVPQRFEWLLLIFLKNISLSLSAFWSNLFAVLFDIGLTVLTWSSFYSPVIQWGRLLYCVMAVWTGSSALLPEVWPPASSLTAEGWCPALPTGPAAGCSAY